MNRVLRALVFALAVALLTAAPAWAQSKLTRSFTTTRWVDLDNGNDSNSGDSAAQAWRTLGKVQTALFPGSTASGDPISVLVILAGTSGGSNATSTGIDQFSPDMVSRTGRTEVGFRMWTAADGSRPLGGVIGRPLLRADNVLSITSSAAWTLVSGTIYKSGNTVVGTPADISSVLYKPGTLSQLDTDGAWKCHLKLTRGTGGDAAATTACSTAWSAYYDTSTKRLYINNGTGSPTTADYSWCLSQTVENFSKIRPIGFDYVGVENVDTLFGERGVVVFDSSKPCQVELFGCRAYEHGVHSLICSYSTTALTNIVFDGCEAHGLGSSSTGNTMMAIAGGSGNNDMTNVRVTSSRIRRYMLQNPAGATYTGTDYQIYPLGIGTSAGTGYGKVKQARIYGSTIEDVTSAKTIVSMASPISVTRCEAPSNPADFNTYPIQFENCDIRTLGTWLVYQGTNFGDFAVAYKNCRVNIDKPQTGTYAWGPRTTVVFYEPATSGTTQYLGIFGGTEWSMDIGLGDAANTFVGFGPRNNSSGGQGLRSYLTARDSSISIVSKANGYAPIFEQNSTSDAANKNLVLDVQRCRLNCVTPLGSPITNTMLVYRDAPAAGNTSRVFLNNEYFNIRQDNWSQANTSYANFVTNVDPHAKLAETPEYVKPDYAPAKVYPGLDRNSR